MKFQRQAKSLDLIDRFEIERRRILPHICGQLATIPRRRPFRAISRSCGLIKTLSSETGKYKVPSSNAGAAETASLRVCATFSVSALRILMRRRIWSLLKHCPVWVRRRQWRLMPCAHPMVGTLGGDDTVFAVMRDNDSAQKFCQQARDILK